MAGLNSHSFQRQTPPLSGVPHLETNWEKLRFVAIDSESTGFDLRRDKLVSLAGVGVVAGEICLWDEFSVMMPVAYNTSSVTVHGITREASAAGVEESEALRRFLEWAHDAIVVGHHIRHDIILLNRACEDHLSRKLQVPVIDTLDAFRALRAAGGFPTLAEPDGPSLDALCHLFGIVLHDRHTALGDAFLTAQILIRILKESTKRELLNLCDLQAWPADQAEEGI